MLEYITVSRDDGVYECFPDLLRTRSGRLLCTYRESESHGGRRYSRLVLREGFEGGRRWGEKRTVVAGPATEDDGDLAYARWNCPRLCQLADGRIVLVCDFSNEWIPELRDKAEVFLWWSEDDGETWSAPQATGVGGIVPDKLCELRDGTLLVATQMTGTVNGTREQLVWRSEDRGETWTGPVVAAMLEGYWLAEASILRLPDDVLVCYMRENSGRGDPGFKSFSLDGGRTWEGPYPTLMEGCHRPVAGMLESGRVLVTYRCDVGGRSRHHNFFAYVEPVSSALERDRKQQLGRILPLDHDNSAVPDTGYSGWVQFPDGRILAVYYIKREAPKAFVRGVLFEEEDVCLGW